MKLRIWISIISLSLLSAYGAWHYKQPKNTIEISRQEYVKLKDAADSLPKEQQHNEHLATDATSTLKQNMELESEVKTCEVDKDVHHVKELLAMQDGIITKQREQINTLNTKLKTCKR